MHTYTISSGEVPGLLISLQMSWHTLFLWMCQTISWMGLEQQLQLQIYSSPLIALIIQGKGWDCRSCICTSVPMWCHVPPQRWCPAVRGSQSGSPRTARRQRHFSSAASRAYLNPMLPSKLKNTHFKIVSYKLFRVLLFSDQSTVGSTVSPPQTVNSSRIPHFCLIFTVQPWYQ